MTITERISPTSAHEESILKFERQLGIRLPDDYRAFLASENGGRPDPGHFDFVTPAGRTGSAVHFFLTLDPDAKYYRIFKEVETYNDRIPEGLLPIACDDFGNLLLLNLSPNGRGGIYFWDHELENLEGDPYWDNVSAVAGSFTEFVNSMH